MVGAFDSAFGSAFDTSSTITEPSVVTARSIIRFRAIKIATANGRSRGFASQDGINPLVATGGAYRTVTDTGALPPTGAVYSWAQGDWLHLPGAIAADRRRFIESYSSNQRTLTHEGPDYDAATVAVLQAGQQPYAILKDDPDLWDSAMNEAFRTLLSFIQYDTVIPTQSGPYHYVISTSPVALNGIQRASQILDIEVRSDTDAAGFESYRSWGNGVGTWHAQTIEHAVILTFNGAPAPAVGQLLRIKWSDQYTNPEAYDDAEEIGVDEYWAALATCVVMSDWLADMNNPDDDWNMIGKRVRQQYIARRRQILGENAFRSVGRHAQRTGIVGVRGRRGRR